MLAVLWRFRGRLAAFVLSFVAGLLLAFAFVLARGLFARRVERGAAAVPAGRVPACAPGETFASPYEILGALGSGDVGVRHGMFRRLFLRPGTVTNYYDYERDVDFPERAERLRLQRVNLDDSPDDEALVTFVRVDSPVAVVLKRYECGWKEVAALSAWLRFEDYPYADWLELPEGPRAGQHLLLVRDSTGDATSYTRRARLLRLAGERLEEVAEVGEEAIAPAEGYAGRGEVKRRRTARLALTPQGDGSPARLRVSYRDEPVRYTGAPPRAQYWMEGDGVWHDAPRHWRTRQSEAVGPAAYSEEQFVWSEQKNRFVPAGP